MKLISLIAIIILGSFDLAAQDVDQLRARLTIMHRRDGGTAQFFEDISNGGTIEYPSRNRHEMFRVYSVYLLGKRPRVTKVVIESYKNDKLLSTATPRFNDLGTHVSFVDGYISTKEDKVKVRLLFESSDDTSTEEWFYLVDFK